MRVKLPSITAPRIQDFDKKSLAAGLGLVVFFYLSLYFYSLVNAAGTYEKMESVLASHKVLLYTPEEERTSEETHKDHAQAPEPEADPETALIKSPVSGLFEDTDYGKLPLLRKHDGMTSFAAYKRPSPPLDSKKPSIAILLTDIGLSPKNAKAALESLPPEISLLLSPYAQSPETWRELSRKKGHETWLNIPAESKNIAHADPGPAALLIRDDVDSNRNRLYWSMARTTGYVGLSSFLDDSFLMAQKNFRAVFQSGLERGLAYLELNPAAADYLQGVTLKAGVPGLKADMWIVRPQGENSFESLEKTAREKGYALGVMPAYPQQTKMLELWLKSLNQKGFVLVPVSSLAEIQKGGTVGTSGHAETLTPHHLDTSDHIEPEPPQTALH